MRTRGTVYCRSGDKDSTHVFNECMDEGTIKTVHIERWMQGEQLNSTEKFDLSPEEAIAVYHSVARDIAHAEKYANEHDEVLTMRAARVATDGQMSYEEMDIRFRKQRTECLEALKLVEEVRKNAQPLK